MDNLSVLNGSANRPIFSLKVKILLLITSLLTITLYSYVLFTQNLLESDKSSYVFESILDKATSISERFYSALSISKNNVMSLEILTENDPIRAKDIITQSPYLLLYQKYLSLDSTWTQTYSLMNRNLMNILSGDYLNAPLNELVKRTHVYLPRNGVLDSGDIKIFPINFEGIQLIGLLARIGNTKEYSLGVLYFPSIQNELSQDGFYKNYIITKSGESLLKNTDKPILNFLKRESKLNVAEGSKRLNINSKDMLVSFIKDRGMGLTFFSITDAKNVFSIIDIIFKKSFYFGIFILGSAVAIGIFFSVSLTNPLQKLMGHLKIVGEGNFDTKVNVTTRDEISTLGAAFNWMTHNIGKLLLEKNKMIKELKKLTSELEVLNKSLEEKVEQRTAELKSAHDFMNAMINSLDQGLVVFDRENTCHNIYTKASVDLFSSNPSGKKYYELLNIESNDEVETIRRWTQSMFTEKIPFSSLNKLGPSKIEKGGDFHEMDYRYIDLSYYPMRNDEGEIQNIVSVATDETEKRRAFLLFKEKESQVNLILKILKNKNVYFSFLSEVEANLIDILKILDKKLELTKYDINTILFNLHSLKGVSDLFHFHLLATETHKAESLFFELKSNDFTRLKEETRYREKILHLVEIFKQQITDVNAVVGDLLLKENNNKVTIQKDDLHRFKNYIMEIGDKDLNNKFDEFFFKVPVKEMLVPYEEFISDMEKRRDDKKFAPLKILGEELRIDPEYYKNFFSSLIHLFRNCVDHGIEQSEERLKIGKDIFGQVIVRYGLSQNRDGFLIEISDDGKGIDPNVLRDKCRTLDIKEAEQMSDQEILYIIFDDRFSSSSQVTHFSGRGVGMSAIMQELRKINGMVNVETEVGQGVCFTFQLPLK